MKQSVLRRLCLLLCLVLLAGCGGDGGLELENESGGESLAPSGIELVERTPADNLFSLNYDPEAPMNPIRAESAANMQFFSLLYDTVFTVDDEFHYSSEIVTGVHTEDYVWWTFDVRQDVTFSDGSPLTAVDIAYSIRMALQQQNTFYKNRLSCVMGISALSNDMFAITTTKADSLLPAVLNIPIIRSGDYFEDFPVGSGPYVLSEDHERLEKNPDNRHAAQLPVDTVYLKNFMDTSTRITAFEDARIDVVTNDPTGMYNLGYGSTNETRYYDTTNMHYIGFNTRSNYFQMVLPRLAVAKLIDRDYVVSDLMNNCGVTAAIPVHPRSGLYDEELASQQFYDPIGSRNLFQEAGVDDLDGDGALEILVTGIVVELRIKFIVNNDSSVKVVAARRICDELNAMGISTTLYELRWEDYVTALTNGDYDMYYGEIRLAMDWDLSYLFQVPETPKEPDTPISWGMNYARNTDERYQSLYRAYLGASDIGRYDAFQNVAQAITESGIIIPICFEGRQVLTHRGVVSGVRATQFDVFHRFYDWTISLG